MSVVDPKLQRILDQVKRLPSGSLFLTKKEIRELPNILSDNEEVVDLVPGFYSGGNGILVATPKRLVFVDKGMLYGLKVEDFPLDKVTSIQCETGHASAAVRAEARAPRGGLADAGAEGATADARVHRLSGPGDGEGKPGTVPGELR